MGRRKLQALCLFLALMGLEDTAVSNKNKKTERTTSDALLFVRGQSLFVQILDDPLAGLAEKPASLELLKLPWQAEEVKSLQVSPAGNSLLIQTKGYYAWTSLSRTPVPKAGPLRFLPCSGSAHFSQDGNSLICGSLDGKSTAVYKLGSQSSVEILAHAPVSFQYVNPTGQVIRADAAGGISQYSVAEQETFPTILSKHRPNADAFLSPDGSRVVGGYTEEKIDVVYTFRLGGKAVKRTLMHAARAVGISSNSKWAAIQQEIDACAVRIAGGQYMCWRRYEARSISSKGRSLLLSRAGEKVGHDLFLGDVKGTSASKPELLVSGVARAASLWPSAPTKDVQQ